jgi:hypothetical protein
MSHDRWLDGRLRVGLAQAAEVVDPPVGSLLYDATVRGRRRLSLRRAVALAILFAVAFPIGLSALTHRFGPSELTPNIPTPAELVGTWRTPALPAADWLDTYRRAGGSEAAGHAFLGPPMAGPAATYQMVLTVSDHEWAVFVSADGRELEAGWHGTYEINGTLVRVHEPAYLCTATYDVALSRGRLRIRVVEDGCGDSDWLAQRTIFETSTFDRAPG